MLKLIISLFAFGSLATTVVYNFFNHPKAMAVEIARPCFVNAMTISIGIALCTACCITGFGKIALSGILKNCISNGLGPALLIIGSVLNIWGRIVLGKNWSDENTLFYDHTLITAYPFRLVRHPLFSALICLFYGLGISYENVLVVVITTVAVVPLLYWRAIEEETFLEKKFPEYTRYAARTGMFFPRVTRRSK